ncbi:histone acetyltransferase 1 [Dispira parvispora]|uniref:Histone acetyltransferase type B catalytic subunit n=1 Tax=Dispira parvispora TaxID=1520584 RepID=A0A9W8E4V1_9FUNG|nr:histone acetyltransferase 1 [Dispira parvispora]
MANIPLPTPQLDYDEWVVDSNDALHLHLVNPKVVSTSQNRTEPEIMTSFDPEFTEPVFGDKRKIFGYKGLHLDLYYSPSALVSHLKMQWDAQHPSVTYNQHEEPPAKRVKVTGYLTPAGGLAAGTIPSIADHTDPAHVLTQYVVIDFQGEDLGPFTMKAQQAEATFQPPGTVVHQYRLEDGKEYVVYRATFESPGFSAYHRRLRSFFLFLVDGASYIDEDPHWEAYMTFQTTPQDDQSVKYSIVGFTTVYNFFCYPDRVRPRISQFLILPPFAGQGHGTHLYEFLYQRWLQDPRVVDIVVEDPNDAFSDLRDRCDLKFLLSQGVSDHVVAPFDAAFLKTFRLRWKLSSRQAARCLEMILLKKLDGTDSVQSRKYRLQVKKRIYLQNQDELIAMDAGERTSKLEEVFQLVHEDHQRMIDTLEV